MVGVQTLVPDVSLFPVSDSGIILQPVQSLGEHTFESVHPRFFKILEFLFNLFTAITLSGSDNERVVVGHQCCGCLPGLKCSRSVPGIWWLPKCMSCLLNLIFSDC